MPAESWFGNENWNPSVRQLFNNPLALDLIKMLWNKFRVNNKLAAAVAVVAPPLPMSREKKSFPNIVTFLMSIYIFLPNDQQHS